MKKKDDNLISDLLFLKDIIIKPYTTMKKHEKHFKNEENTLKFFVNIVLIILVFTILGKMINSCFLLSYNIDVLGQINKVYEFSLTGLSNVNWLLVIIEDLMVITMIILSISLVYYVATTIIKKESTFSETIANTTASFVPFSIGYFIIAPLLNLIAPCLGIFTAIIFLIYSLLILIELNNSDVDFKNVEQKLLYNLVTLSVIVLGLYFTTCKIIDTNLIGIIINKI